MASIFEEIDRLNEMLNETNARISRLEDVVQTSVQSASGRLAVLEGVVGLKGAVGLGIANLDYADVAREGAGTIKRAVEGDGSPARARTLRPTSAGRKAR